MNPTRATPPAKIISEILKCFLPHGSKKKLAIPTLKPHHRYLAVLIPVQRAQLEWEHDKFLRQVLSPAAFPRVLFPSMQPSACEVLLPYDQ